MQCNEALSWKSYSKYLEADKMKGKVEESVITHFNGHSFDSVKSLDFEFISGLIERQLKNNWAGCSRVRWAGHLTVQTHLQSFNSFGFCFASTVNQVLMERQPKINWWARCSRVRWAPAGQNTSWRLKLKARNLGKTLQSVGGELSAVFKIGFSIWLKKR